MDDHGYPYRKTEFLIRCLIICTQHQVKVLKKKTTFKLIATLELEKVNHLKVARSMKNEKKTDWNFFSKCIVTMRHKM